METELIFQISTCLAMAGWLLLIISPYIDIANQVIQKGLIPILLGLIYAYFIIAFFGQAEGSFSSLEGVMSLFTYKEAVLAGWIHYLAFDLWVGCWEVSDAKKNGVAHLFIIPSLGLTFMFGPIGLISYLLIRSLLTRKLSHNNFKYNKTQ